MNHSRAVNLVQWTMVVVALGLLILWRSLLPASAASPRNPVVNVRYVSPTGLASGACDSWENACDLQFALGIAIPGEELWVKQGLYKPTSGSDRTATFQLKTGVAVYGGYAGTETTHDQRDWQANVTVLSGDIDQNDLTDSNGVIADTVHITGTNAYHVVNGSGTDSTAVLNGFTITAGQANGVNPDAQGGGMYNSSGSPALANLIFSGNQALWFGGGMLNANSSSPTITSATFSGNQALVGGGMYNHSSSPALTNVTFSGNTADNSGGGMYNHSSSPAITNADFSGNQADYGGGMLNHFSSPAITNADFSGNQAEYGGGMLNENISSPTITNAAFSGNQALSFGGGLYNVSSSPVITNATFSGNQANWGGVMYNDYSSSPIIRNSILWGNAATNGPQVYNSSSTPAFTYSLVEGCNPDGTWNAACGADGGNNLADADPLFVNPIAANSAPTTTGNYRLQAGSPAINAGNNAALPPGILTDLDGAPRFVRVFVDLGAYENQTFHCPVGGVLFVDQDATGDQTGESWEDALTTLQDALQVTDACEIWVAEGIYYPDQGGSQANNDPTTTFQLKSGVALYGGFAGTETSREQRNWEINLTILSGDIDKNDLTDPDGVITETVNISGTNSYRVVRSSGVTETAVLDGFFITGGQAITYPYDIAGGMYNSSSSPTLSNLTFSGNTAGSCGGIFNESSSPTLTHVAFSGNLAIGSGGGMCNASSSPTLMDVTFSGNSANTGFGGGMYNWNNSSPMLTDVTFSGNSAHDGGGIYNNGTLLVANSTFSENSVTYSGGGIYNNGTLTVTNSTFSGNSATTYGASFGGGIYNGSTLTITNSILSGNSATYGGGISTFGTLRVTNSMLSGNHAAYASGINNYGALTVTNCTLSGNLATNWAAGIYNNTTSAPFIQNSIFWNEADTGAQIVYTPSSPSPVIRNSIVRGCNPSGIWNSACGTDGGNNLADADPLFVDPEPASSAPTTAGDYRLQDASPAINMGDNAADLDGSGPLTATIGSILADLSGDPRFVRVFVDLGAYENQTFPCPASGVLYVDKDATGAQTGASWGDALVTLQDALQVTEACETWVAEGIYYPDEGGSQADNDRAATFQLKSGLALYGGFAGTETTRDGRNWETNITVLSGDIDNNDTGDPHGIVTDTMHITGANCYHVVTASTVDATAVLDGFTITAGLANGAGNDTGGGMHNRSGSPTLADVVLTGNRAQLYGGGMSNEDSNPGLTNVSFTANHAVFGGGLYSHNSSESLVDVTFRLNSAEKQGGGMYSAYGSNLTVENVSFNNNTAGTYGGGLSIDSSIADLSNVRFYSNHADLWGGGIFAYGGNLVFSNLTVYGNDADNGGGIYNWSSNPVLQNSILWGNTASTAGSQIYNQTSSPLIHYSLVEGGCPAGSTCNQLLNTNPLFVDAASGDLRLQDNSPAVNAGNNAALPPNILTDLDGNPRFVRVFVDIGAYENQTFLCPAGGVLYVDQDATGDQTGASWEDALVTLQDALQVTEACEIWVAEGVYYPDQGGSKAVNDRSATFTQKNSVALYGGFGGTETSREQRNWETNLTILSGDIDLNDLTDPNGVITETANISGTNSYHVVSSTGVTETAVLDGFTITAGQANAPGYSYQVCNAHNCGGGMFNEYSSPMLTNLIFSGNMADHDGGGMYNGNSSPTLNAVTFTSNTSAAWDGGGMFNRLSSPVLTNVAFYDNRAHFFGGGMCNYPYSSPTLTNVTFSGNQATHGGGMTNRYFSNPVLSDVTFDGNVGGDSGGGMWNFQSSSPTLTNVVFSGNASGTGGGMNNYGGCNASLTNVIFSDNEANTGGGMYNYYSDLVLTQVLFSGNKGVNGGAMHNLSSSVMMTNITIAGNLATGNGGGIYNDHGIYNDGSDPYIQNTLIWGNQSGSGSDNLFNSEFSSPTIRYSLVQGCKPGGTWNSACGTDGGNNLPDADPLFVAPEPASSAPTTTGDYRLQDASPAINQGDNTADLDGTGPLTATISSLLADLDGNPRFVRVFVDLGAYENQTFPCPAGGVLYVDQDAAGAQTGASWGDALVTLQDALQVTDACEIWVAEGIYYPDEGGSQADNDRTATFLLKSGLTVFGGFDGTEITRDQRDWTANVTVLSGDIDGNDLTDPNGVVTTTAGIIGDNSYHVVTSNDATSTTIIDGFFITAGLDTGVTGMGGGMDNSGGSPTLANVTFSGNSSYSNGGGMGNSHSSPTLTNITFSGNAAYNGGGMFNLDSSPTLTNVTFSGNTVTYLGGGMVNTFSNPTLTNVTFSGNSAGCGGGMYTDSSSPTLSNVTFSGNSATNYGGGMYNSGSNPTLTGVTFSGNSAADGGGGVYIQGSGPILTDVTFSGNSSAGRGGGMFNWGTSPSLINVIFTSNSANEGGGMYNDSSTPTLANAVFHGNGAIGTRDGGGFGGGMLNDASSPTLTNVTFWGNGGTSDGGGMYNRNSSHPTILNSILTDNSPGQMVNDANSHPTISYCDMPGGCPAGSTCSHFMDTGPLFVYPWTGDLRLSPDSPVIDAGNNAYITLATDLAGEPRFIDIPGTPDTGTGTAPLVDLGAYEASFVDVGIQKTVLPASAAPGQTITYTLAFSNGGNLVAENIRITDTLPAYLDAQLVEFSGVTVTDTGHIPAYVWAVQNLTAGQSGLITLTVVLTDPLAVDVYTNTAHIYAANDARLRNDQAETSLVVINVPPLVYNDGYQTNEDIPLLILAPGVLANDRDPNNDLFSASLVSGPAHGQLYLAPNGSFTYTPTLNYAGSDSFTYHASDGLLNSTIATVNLTIHPVNDPPAGANQAVTTLEDTDHILTAANFGFSDPLDNPPHQLGRVKITTLPGQGMLKLNGAAVVTGQFVIVGDITANLLVFTPASNAHGTPYASITFQVEDNGGTDKNGVNLDPTPNTLTIHVTSVNDPPAGTDTTVALSEDIAYPFTSADFGFSDPNDTPTNHFNRVKITTLPSQGILLFTGNEVAAGQYVNVSDLAMHKLTFTGAPNGTGFPYTTFTFQVEDDGGTANGGANLDPSPNTITLEVTPVNDPPVFDLPQDVTINEDAGEQIVPLTGIDDGDAEYTQTLQVTVLSSAPGIIPHPTVVYTSPNATGTIKFTPLANANGDVLFTVTVTDNGSGIPPHGNTTSLQFTIHITPVNDTPAAAADSYTANEDTRLVIPAPGILDNDEDVDGDILTANLDSGSEHGILSLSPDGSFIYTPTHHYTGPDSFSYHANDGVLDSNIITVTLWVNPRPVVNAGPDQVADEGESIAFTGSYTDSRLRSELAIHWDFGDSFTAEGSLTPTHAFGNNGVYTVTLTITDSLGAVGADTLVVTVTNVAPSLPELNDLAGAPGVPVTLHAAFIDPGWLDTHTVEIQWLPGQTQTVPLAAGVLEFTGQWQYPQEGSYPVTVTVTDQDGASAAGSFTVIVKFFRVYLPILYR